MCIALHNYLYITFRRCTKCAITRAASGGGGATDLHDKFHYSEMEPRELKLGINNLNTSISA